MINPQIPMARKNGIVIQELPNELLVYELETNKAHCLNKTAAFVWKKCDGKTSVEEIVLQFEKQTGKRIEEDLVWLALDQLKEHKLLENNITSKFVGESRRSVLKRIGLASVIALPIISSLTVPVAAQVACSGIQTPASCASANCNSNTLCTSAEQCGDCPPGTSCRCTGSGSPTCSCRIAGVLI